MANKTKVNSIKEYSAEQLSEFVPHNLPETIAYLEKVFPAEMPTLKDNDREIWIKVGRQEVIKFLKTTLNKEEDSNVFP